MSINIKPSNKGKLHRALGIKEGNEIPNAVLAEKKKKAGPALKKEIVFAQNAREWHNH